MNILIVDDDPDDIDVFREALNTINPSIKCLSAKDGEDAWSLLRKESPLPSYIFLDVNMPVMNGKEFLIHVKNSTRFKHIHVIIYSTTSNKEEIIEFKKLGAHEFLVKASSFHELVQSISRIIN